MPQRTARPYRSDDRRARSTQIRPTSARSVPKTPGLPPLLCALPVEHARHRRAADVCGSVGRRR